MREQREHGILIGVLSVGLLCGGLTGASQGQTCPTLQGCDNTIPSTADFATVSGGTSNTASGIQATVGGGDGNRASGPAATVSGGNSNVASGVHATVGGGFRDLASGNQATVGGGDSNTASGELATVGGGFFNSASGTDATVGGGHNNTASSHRATVGGGERNVASHVFATVGGGHNNTASGVVATVGGGIGNRAVGIAATVAGGYRNLALGQRSWAGGSFAEARHHGAWVWSDMSAPDRFFSTALNQLSIRAARGVRIFSNADATVGVQLRPNTTGWSVASGRELKEDFRPVDKQAVLAEVERLPIMSWQLKGPGAKVRHLGPVAQDFHAAFQVGADERDINSVDADGVALVAIQALAERNAELQAQVRSLLERVGQLERRGR